VNMLKKQIKQGGKSGRTKAKKKSPPAPQPPKQRQRKKRMPVTGELFQAPAPEVEKDQPPSPPQSPPIHNPQQKRQEDGLQESPQLCPEIESVFSDVPDSIEDVSRESSAPAVPVSDPGVEDFISRNQVSIEDMRAFHAFVYGHVRGLNEIVEEGLLAKRFGAHWRLNDRELTRLSESGAAVANGAVGMLLRFLARVAPLITSPIVEYAAKTAVVVTPRVIATKIEGGNVNP
jgi:hypothetical protein